MNPVAAHARDRGVGHGQCDVGIHRIGDLNAIQTRSRSVVDHRVVNRDVHRRGAVGNQVDRVTAIVGERVVLPSAASNDLREEVGPSADPVGRVGCERIVLNVRIDPRIRIGKQINAALVAGKRVAVGDHRPANRDINDIGAAEFDVDVAALQIEVDAVHSVSGERVTRDEGARQFGVVAAVEIEAVVLRAADSRRFRERAVPNREARHNRALDHPESEPVARVVG